MVNEQGNLDTGKIEVAQVIPTGQTAEAIQGQSVRERTALSVKEFQDEMKGKEIDTAKLRELMDKIEKAPKEKKAGMLSLIFISLNKKGVTPRIDVNGKFTPFFGKQNISESLHISNSFQTGLIQNIFNEALDKKIITLKDIYDAMLFRTTGINDYIDSKGEKGKLDTKEYFVTLCFKYPEVLSMKTPDGKNKVNSGTLTYETLSKIIHSMTQKEYLNYLKGVYDSVTDEGDREFIMNGLDDIRGRNGINLNSESVSNYKNLLPLEERKKLQQLSQSFTQNEKYALNLPLGKSFEAMETRLKNDPVSVVTSLTEDDLWFGVIGALLGGYIGGDFLTALAGFAGGVGLSVAGPAGVEYFMGQGDGKDKGTSKPREGGNEPTNDFFQKYKYIVRENIGSLDGTKLKDYFAKLTQNEKFKKSDAGDLNIFNKGTEFPKLQEEFKTKFGIELTSENKDYYTHIFKRLKDNRVKNIGENTSGETVIGYINRGSKVETQPNFKNALNSSNVEGKDMILNVLKSNNYKSIRIGELKALVLDENQLKKTFEINGELAFYNKYKASISEILKLITSNVSENSKTLGEVLN